MPELKYKYYSDVEEAEVDWLWYPYIPYGKITLLQGDPGEGKSTFILNIASLLTNGSDMPDGYPNHASQTVVYQCNEDSAADTIKPRLLKAGADCSKVAFIEDEDGAVTLDDSRIEEVIRKTNAKLLILDPLQSFIPQDVDMQSAAKMRMILGKLGNIAKENGCAVVLVGHMTKAQGNKSLYRGLGSIDIPAIARSVLMIERDEQTPNVRYLHHIKSSLAEEGKDICFSLGTSVGFQWVVNDDLELLQELRNYETKAEAAERLIEILLAEGKKESNLIITTAERLGISKRTISSVKKKMGVISERKNRLWYWKMVDKELEVQK